MTCFDLLNNELNTRKSRNSAYSLRAFARDLGISPTAISDFLNGKRQLSKTNLNRICESLNLSPLQREALFKVKKNSPSQSASETQRIILADDTFRVIADWYYLAILNLAKIKTNSANPKWIAERLAISSENAADALERLIRLGFIKVKRGRLHRTAQALGTLRDIPSLAIKKHHTDNLNLAREALHNVPVELREFSSTTMAISISQLAKAKDLLMKSKHKVASVLEKGDADAVYVLSFQLFPLSKNEVDSAK
jgi:uncharacterized protein (TIGR02147 family)